MKEEGGEEGGQEEKIGDDGRRMRRDEGRRGGWTKGENKG